MCTWELLQGAYLLEGAEHREPGEVRAQSNGRVWATHEIFNQGDNMNEKRAGMTLMTVPKDYKDCGLSMSNFDGCIDEGFEEILKKEKVYGHHYAWDFCARVWYADSLFYSEIKRYRVHIDTIVAKSLSLLMAETNAKHGPD